MMGDLSEGRHFDREGLPENIEGVELNVDQKLGHLYEDGLGQLLRASERYDLLEQGLQIQSDRHHTLGELDFLMREKGSERLIHLELAVKFYLAMESTEGLRLPGPDARDNYYKKLDHLRGHQLTLCERHRECLPERYQAETIEPQHLVIGCLFDHFSSATQAQPEGLLSSVRRGRWLYERECREHFGQAPIVVIPKPLWPVPIDELSFLPSSFFQEVEFPVSRCVMVMVEGVEFPVFIAPNDYPTMDQRET